MLPVYRAESFDLSYCDCAQAAAQIKGFYGKSMRRSDTNATKSTFKYKLPSNCETIVLFGSKL